MLTVVSVTVLAWFAIALLLVVAFAKLRARQPRADVRVPKVPAQRSRGASLPPQDRHLLG